MCLLLLPLVLLSLVFVVIGPIITIWALQTLGVPIELTVWTYLAVGWFHIMVGSLKPTPTKSKDQHELQEAQEKMD